MSYHTKTTDLISQFVLENQDKGFTAFEVSDFLSKKGMTVNKTTVYRNLEKLTEKGQLVKFKSLNSEGYVYKVSDENRHCENHLHFQCKKCGFVIHISDKMTLEYLESISKTFGFEIDLRSSMFNGLCQKCKTQN